MEIKKKLERGIQVFSGIVKVVLGLGVMAFGSMIVISSCFFGLLGIIGMGVGAIIVFLGLMCTYWGIDDIYS